jgi:tetratricopeptide (TPR) repeat protein
MSMFMSRTDSWSRVRESFADQFEQDGSNFIYRRSQKGEAFRVSPAEHDRFLDEFDRNLSRAKWIIYLGLTVVLGGIVLFSFRRSSDLSQGVLFLGVGLAMMPYLAYYRWAWAAPARELAGRIPIAGARASEEVRRLRFQRITYGQLAGAAFGGLMIPFIGSSRQNVFSGWNRLWLVFGGALILLAAVQAFRKWRFEQENTYRNVVAPSFRPNIIEPSDEPASLETKAQLWRYVPFALIVLAIAFIALTPMGKQLAQTPSFWPIVMIGCAGWSLFTVVQGFRKGQIEPFARGFYNTYERKTQPKRFWASMAWNGIFGCLLLWFAFMMNGSASARAVNDRCFNDGQKYSPQESLSACDQLIDKKVRLVGWTTADVFVSRGIEHGRLKDNNRAIADFSEALRLQPQSFAAYFNRGVIYGELDNRQLALADFSAAIRLKPDPNAYFDRGFVYARTGDMQSAIADFSQVVHLTPGRAEAYYYRAVAYRNVGDTQRATTDFATAFRLDPKLCHGCVERYR